MTATFRTWEQLSVVEQLQSDYSDFYKEVNGFRPRFMSDEQWNSEAWLRAELAILAEQAKVVAAEETRRETEAVAKFEKFVEITIAAGASDRETALRWIMDGSGYDGDWEYLCFGNGLPYGYFRRAE